MIKSEPGFTLSARQPMCQNMLVLLPSNLTLAYTSNQQYLFVQSTCFHFEKAIKKSVCPWLPLWPNCPDLSNMSGFTVHLKLLLTWLQSWMCPRERGRKSLLDPIIFDGNPEISNDHQPEQLEEDCRQWARTRSQARRLNLFNDHHNLDHDDQLDQRWSGLDQLKKIESEKGSILPTKVIRSPRE